MEAAAQTASLFEAGRNCYAVAHADRVALLVDGEAYFRAFAHAAERATRSILIVAWDFSSTTRLHFDGEARHGAPSKLGDFLNWLARRRRELHIRILDWDYPMLFSTDREFPPPSLGLGWKPHRRVRMVYDNTHPVGASHHQKIVVIDDALAFVGGFDLTDRRWDTSAHCADDHRRMAGSNAYPPFHDLMIAVDGEAARALGEVARARWLAATEQVLPPPPAGADPWPPTLPVDFADIEVAIARTLPPTGEGPQVREVEALYLDMIGAAQSYIYIENQYFTAYRIAEALAARLGEPAGPEIVLVLRLLSHGWLEEHTMHVLRTRLIQGLREADRHGRFHLYYAHIDGLKDGTCIDVHAKLMIVDDEILRIGSANLCNRSMALDSECDIALEAGGQARHRAVIGDFRDRLLAEHLDVPVQQVSGEIRQRGGVHAAIEALRGRPRTLKPFEALPEWPDAVVDMARVVADPDGPLSLDRLFETWVPPPPHGPDLDFRSAGLKLLGLALALAGLWALWHQTPLADYLSIERVIAWAQEFADRPWAPLIILGAYTPACLLMFPRPLITLGAVVAFGPVLGAAYALAGILLAALVTYLAGRRLPRQALRRLVGRRFGRITATLRRRGLLAVTALRLVPVAPFAILGLVAGALRIRLWHFMLGTLIGILPGTLATTLFGRQIEAALRDPSQISYGLLAGMVLVLIALSLTVRRWLVRQTRESIGQGREGGRA